ncbi:unnamed protein product [Fusarium graminearum]|nr:hypothetical protein FG05_30299 [Fusarium graminearum]CZS82968.1 unnamed protein product [Fusarium graminearum]
MSSTKNIQIAIVGAGPRGTSTLERICASASQILPEGGKLIVHVIDPYPPGPGRVWQIDQPPRLLMNTIAEQVTLFTDPSVKCEGPNNNKHMGPSLYDWGKDADGFRLGPKDYPTRSQHGLYLKWAFGEILRRARENQNYDILIKVHRTKAVKLDDEHGNNKKQTLTLATCTSCGEATELPGLSAVILTQGHVAQRLNEAQQKFVEHARAKPGARYFPPSNPAEINFDCIDAGEKVVLRGLGLVFFDYMILLTARRGGWFERRQDGSFKYNKSGDEPIIYAGSRRGIPYQSKGDDQKTLNEKHESKFLTSKVIEGFQQRALGVDPPKFKEDVWPLISREVRLVYYNTLITKRQLQKSKDDVETRLRNEVVEGTPENESENGDKAKERSIAKDLGLHEDDAFSWDHLGHPERKDGFKSTNDFTSVEHWNKWLLGYLQQDAADAREGNVKGPLKAALDVLREIRNDIRLIVNNGGLDSKSHVKDLAWFTAYNSFLSVGPPRRRVEQMIALMEANVLKTLGPGLTIKPAGDQWSAASGITNSQTIVQTVIDASVSAPKLSNTADELLKYLYDTEQCRAHSIGKDETGAIDINKDFKVMNKAGESHSRRFALGVPAEGVHWATTIQPRPCMDSISLRQTDIVARAALRLGAGDMN